MPSSVGNVTGSNLLPGLNPWQFGICLRFQVFLCMNSYWNLHWLTGCPSCCVSFATVRACVGLMLATSFKKILARCQVCFPRSVSSGMLPSTSYVWTLEAPISHPCYFKKLEVISRKLMQHLRGQRRPALTHVNVGGVLLRFPIRADALVGKRVSIAKADAVYLAGFFDGDGCVAPEMNLSGFQLRVGQQIGSSSILIAFLYRFGGTISACHSGTGTKQPTIQWRVSGQTARKAAAELHKHCLVKKEQLEVALHWPGSRKEREQCTAKLKALKKSEPNIMKNAVSSWGYISGFFDAEGCIRIFADCTLRLEVAQRDLPILEAIRSFLSHKLPDSHICMFRRKELVPFYSLSVGEKKAVVKILDRMLVNGLLVKRATAEHVLRSINLPRNVLRSCEPALKGHQSFFQKLDAAGCERSRSIKGLGQKCRRAMKTKTPLEVDELNSQLASAKLEHAILNMLTRIKRLRAAIATIPAASPQQHGVPVGMR